MSKGKTKVHLTEAEKQKIVNQVAAVGIAGNIVLTAFKMFAGIVGNSTAMVTDAIHSLSDVFATFIAFVGVKISKKGADASHPYGHERFECFASILLGLILTYTGVHIGWGCIQNIIHKEYRTAQTPGMIAIAAAVISIVAKEGMYWYTIFAADKIESSAFRADAWHHRSDAFSSVGSLIGILGARMGFPIMDVLAGLVICAIIIHVGLVEVILDAVDKLVDHAGDPETDKEIKEIVNEYSKEHDMSIGIDSLMTRQFGEKLFADLEINLDGNMPLHEAHLVADDVHGLIEKKHPEIKHITVHVNPNGYPYGVGE